MMRFLTLNPWGSEIPRFVYKDEVSVEVKAGVGKEGADEALPEVAYDPAKKTEREQWEAIDAKYGQSAYEAIISAYADRIMPTTASDHKEALLRDSTRRYMKSYNRIRLKFMTEAKDLRKKFDDAVDRVKTRTKSELDVLKSAVEGGRPLTEFKEGMPGPENRDAVMEHFENYLDALNGRYFNVNVNRGATRGPGIPLLDPLIHVEVAGIPLIGSIAAPDTAKYNSQSSDFQENMKNWVEARLNWILNKKGTKKEDLEAFKAEITARYERYAKLDGNPRIISGADLMALERAVNVSEEAVVKMMDVSDERMTRWLELIQMLKPDVWEEAVETRGETVIQAAENSGAEKEFVAEMKKYRPAVKDFGDAESEFKDMLEGYTQASVNETLDFIRQFNVGVHGEVLQYEESVKPPALTTQTHKQLDYLLNGVLTPQKDTDKMLVRFMNSNLDGRNDILANNGTREILFRAIRQATEQYPEIYDKQFGNIPDDAKKLRRSPRIEQPTHHDRAAQMQALIILGNQAKVIVSRLQRAPEHAGKSYVEEIANAKVPEDPSVVRTGLRFKAPVSAPGVYRSALERGGFNARDLTLKGAKVFGAITVLCNVAQSWSETSGDFVDRVFETAERAATNTSLLAGAAVTVGAHMAERDPRFLKYPWLSQHERDGVMTSFKLDNLAARVSLNEMNRFLYNNAEWRALQDPAMDPTQIKEMIQEAAKRTARGSHPVITVEDLKKVIKDESIISTLTSGGKSARTRYLFYKDFFSAATKPDVNHVKELCTGGSHISPSPVETK